MLAAAYSFLLAAGCVLLASSEDIAGCPQGEICDQRTNADIEESQLLSVDLLQQSEIKIDRNVEPEFSLYGADAAPKTTTTPDPTGMTMNAVGDGEAFVSALITNIVSVFVFMYIFSLLRKAYPIMFYDNSIKGDAPELPETTWGWWSTTLGLKIDDVAENISLDTAMMIEYTHWCMKVLLWIGIPMFFVVGPINMLFGGYAAGEDHLSYFSFGNVENGSDLYWMHAVMIWYVTLNVSSAVYRGMEGFLPKRVKWLRTLPLVRSNTILVECIPEEHQTEKGLVEFWRKLLPHCEIKSTYIAKDTSELKSLLAVRDTAAKNLQVAETALAESGERPTVSLSMFGESKDAIEHWQKSVEEVKQQINAERDRIAEYAVSPAGINSSNGFITFKHAYEAELALRLSGISNDAHAWQLSSPPAPSDVLWDDLTQDNRAQAVRHKLGYLLVLGLYFAYMPIVVGVTNIAKVLDWGPLWQGLAPTMGLQLMVAFLPTFLLIIFRSCFTLKADAFAQYKLQTWYFWFQIVFVVLATAVGQNVKGFTQTLMEKPFAIFGVMAKTMPYATHFYMNFLVLAWTTHAMGMMRYVPLAKYKVALKIWDEAGAKQVAEPEDQDYYGMGGRSARWAIFMTIGIVYGTLSPPINVLCFINFAVSRIAYGYLMVFAETKKPDLGGVFFVKQMEHMNVALIIYGILMTGVLMQRAATYGPGMIAAGALVYAFYSNACFHDKFNWEKLPFEEMADDETKYKHKEEKAVYMQPEMIEAEF
mmetsp:Transcript_97/g.238  ORF Transcript_97/g.238 Transcript_97/m.238 type:complete len:760 (-) Transcript_97:181-2460(-)